VLTDVDALPPHRGRGCTTYSEPDGKDYSLSAGDGQRSRWNPTFDVLRSWFLPSLMAGEGYEGLGGAAEVAGSEGRL